MDSFNFESLIDDTISMIPDLGDQEHYHDYNKHPVKFATEVLGDTITPDVKAMMRSVRDYPVTICVTGNGVGKTHAAARVAIWWLRCFDNSQCYTAAAPPEGNLKRLLWGEIEDVAHKKPDVFKNLSRRSLHIDKSPREFLTGVTIPSSGTEAEKEARFSGKHAENLLFILDEADGIPDVVYKGIESCLSGGTMQRLLIMFNPRAKQGAPYRMIRDGVANVISMGAFTHPNVIAGDNIIPGAVDRATTLRRINQWTRPLKDGERTEADTFTVPDFLVGCAGEDQSGKVYPPLEAGERKINSPAFSYMVLGQFPSQSENALISNTDIERARKRWDDYVLRNGEIPPNGYECLAGLDISEFGADSNALCQRYSYFVPRIDTWSGMEIPDTVSRASQIVSNIKLDKISCDATGVGAGVAATLARAPFGLPAVDCKVAKKATKSSELGEFGILRDQLWWAVREWLRDPQGIAMLPPDEKLCEELLVATYSVDDGKVRVMQKSVMRDLLKRSPDKADSLCLTFYDGAEYSSVFPGVSKQLISEPRIEVLPVWYTILGGIRFGSTAEDVAAVLIAHDTDTGAVHLVRTWQPGILSTPAALWTQLQTWGKQTRWVYTGCGLNADRESIKRIAEQYKNAGFRLVDDQYEDRAESGTSAMIDLMLTGRFKASSTLIEFWDQLNGYFRVDGKIESNSSTTIIDACRVAVVHKQHAGSEAQYEQSAPEPEMEPDY